MCTICLQSIWAKDSVYFFTAKSTIKLVQNNTENEFDAHIRFNLKDSLWISFTGPFGIEGARMLYTQDSIFVINKLANSFTALSSTSESEFIPFVFNFDDWNAILLGIPYKVDLNTNTIKNDSITDQTHFIQDQIKKLVFKKNQLTQCQYSHTKHSENCIINFYEFEDKNNFLSIPLNRDVRILSNGSETYYFSLKYTDYEFNKPAPFTFNSSKYRNAE